MSNRHATATAPVPVPISTTSATPVLQESRHWLGRGIWMTDKQASAVHGNGRSGLFIPYPLLGIIVPLLVAVVAGLGALYMQVSSLSTNMTNQQMFYQQQVHDLMEKQAQLEVYIHDDREKLIRLQTTVDQIPKKRE